MAISILNARVWTKYLPGLTAVPTVPTAIDHNDPAWLATDIYNSELALNEAGILYTRYGSIQRLNRVVTVGDPISGIATSGHFLYNNAGFVGFKTISAADIADFNEAAQDALNLAFTDTNTIDVTYNDGSNSFSFDVRTQMSITSDVNGIKLVNDATTPGNSKFYGTTSAGVKGWRKIKKADFDDLDAYEVLFGAADGSGVVEQSDNFLFRNGNLWIGSQASIPVHRLHTFTSGSDNVIASQSLYTGYPTFAGKSSRGTLTSPQPSFTDDVLAVFSGRGYSTIGSPGYTGDLAGMRITAQSVFDPLYSSTNDGGITFFTAQDGSLTDEWYMINHTFGSWYDNFQLSSVDGIITSYQTNTTIENGELLIGRKSTTGTPPYGFVRGLITSPGNTIAIGYDNPDITLDLSLSLNDNEVLFGADDGSIDQDSNFTYDPLNGVLSILNSIGGYYVDDGAGGNGSMSAAGAVFNNSLSQAGHYLPDQWYLTDGSSETFATATYIGIRTNFPLHETQIHRTSGGDTTYNLYLPNAQGGLNTVLRNDGSGNLSWVSFGTGSVTSIATTSPIGGGTITTTGTLRLLASAADKYLYSTGVDTWTEGAITSFARSILDDTAASDVRTTLGLVIGTNVQAFDATLLSIAALGTAADKIAYTTAIDTWAETTLTSFGRSLIDDADNTSARTTLGLVIGTDVQAFDATLTSLAAISGVQGDIIYASGTDTWTRLAKDTGTTRYLSNTGTSNNPAWAQVALATGISGFGTGVADFLATPSSANLRTALTDENGTGALLFSGATSPSFAGTVAMASATLTGTVTTYNNIATANNGLGMSVGTPVHLTGQTAAIAATTFHTTEADGFYMATVQIAITTTGGTTVGCQIKFTNQADNVVKTLPTNNNNGVNQCASTSTNNAICYTQVMYCKTGTVIQYVTNIAGSGQQYSLDAFVFKL